MKINKYIYGVLLYKYINSNIKLLIVYIVGRYFREIAYIYIEL